MKTIGYLTTLALLLVSCSETNTSSPIIDEDKSSSSIVDENQSSSSFLVIPEMSSSSNEPTLSSNGSTTSSSSTISTNPSSSSKLPPISLVARTPGLAKTLNVVGNMEVLPYDVELDTIMGTDDFLFGIKNNSSSDISGLKFEFDLDYFKVTPDSIITLGAVGSATGIEIYPLIKVTVEHGTLASGRGFTNVLTGNQYGKLTISGKNADGDFSVTYTMHVYAKRMIINIDIPDTTVDGIYIQKSLTLAKALRHAHVDPSSDDCYLNMGELTLDTSSNVRITDVRDNYTAFNGVSDINTMYLTYSSSTYNPYIDSLTHIKFINELNIAKRLETYSYVDNNCVILVNDNWPITNGYTNWVTTQRIID